MQRRNRKTRPALKKKADGEHAKRVGEKSPRQPPRPAVVAVALFLLCLTCYLANGRTQPADKSFDTLPNRLLPFSVLAFHTLTLDPFAAELGPHLKYYAQHRRGHLVGFYPIGAALVAFPIYLPAWAWLSARGRITSADLFAATPALEKVSASVIAALAVVFVYLTLRRRVSARTAFLASVGLGLGTSMWATASQLLWQHGPVALSIAAGFFFLTDPERSMRSVVLAGLAYSLAVATRPTAAVFWMAAFGALLLDRRPLRERFTNAAWFAAAGIPAVLFSTAFNLYWYSNPLGGYSLKADEILGWRDLPIGAAGLLVSPNRGLFLFSPIVFLGIVGLVRSFRRFSEEPLLPMLAIAAMIHFLFISGSTTWAGGWAFGPRYLVDILPILALGAGLELPHLGRAAGFALAVALVWSVLVQWDGAFCYPASGWNPRFSDFMEKAAWDWGQFELWQDFKQWKAWPFWATPY
jgi:hypothetical protein